jgi:hypothetical protein
MIHHIEFECEYSYFFVVDLFYSLDLAYNLPG